jgi:predicted metal-binding transcription factor (methanogenesis marker protein 9)
VILHKNQSFYLKEDLNNMKDNEYNVMVEKLAQQIISDALTEKVAAEKVAAEDAENKDKTPVVTSGCPRSDGVAL